MIKYKFKPKKKILFLTYKGRIEEIEIFELYKKLFEDERLPENLLIFQDENKAEFIQSEKLINVSLDLIKKLKEKFNSIKIAVWQNDPIKTAYSYLYKEMTTDNQYEIEIFFTKEAALVWLKEKKSK